MRHLIRYVAALAATVSMLMAADAAEPHPAAVTGPHPRTVEPPSSDAVHSAIRRGVDFLLRDRNRDGSWGSATRTKRLNIYAPIPGAHQAFRVAVTALATSALIQSGDQRAEVHQAIDRADEWLQQYLPRARRATGDAIYNVWAHAYAIEALVDLLEHGEHGSPRDQQLRALAGGQIDMLQRFESVDHGWGYYDFRAQADRPTSNANSFTTATVVIALLRARSAGVDVPEDLIDHALRSIRRQQKPDFSYYYKFSGPTRNSPMRGINRPGGSLGRSQVCNLALRMGGDSEVTDEVLHTWLHRLFARNGWLDIGRKRPIPHEAHFQVAGYFFYYGHWYAARTFELLPAEERRPHQIQMARLIVDLQEKDGSWWDYPLYAYHQPYGTAMAIMTLVESQTAEMTDGYVFTDDDHNRDG